MGARRKKPVVHLPGSAPANTDVDADDVTAQTHPEGIPTNPDGSVSSAVTEVPIERARGLGALGAESAARNKSMARKIDRRTKGETGVPFNEDNAIIAFDMVRTTFGPSTILVCFKNLDTQVDFAPQKMAKFRSSDELYAHVQAQHRRSPQARYEITFKDVGTYQIRHKSYLVMPDTLDDAGGALAPPPQQVYGLPPYPGMPAGFGSAPYGAPQPPPASTPPAASAPPAPSPPPGLDPFTAQLFAELRALREQFAASQMQNAAVYGGLEEFKRQQAQAAAVAAAAPSYPTPQAIPPAPAPPQASPPSVEPYRTAGPPPPQVELLGMDPVTGRAIYGVPFRPQGAPAAAQLQPQQQQQQPQGFGAIPPPPAPKPVDPTQQLIAAVAQVAGMKKAIDGAVKAFGAQVAEPDEPTPPPEPEPLPITPIPMGAGEDPPQLAVNAKDGSINWGATFMGNAHRLPGILDHMTRSLGNLNRQMGEAQARRPIMVEATSVPSPPMPPRAVPAPSIPIPPRP